MNITEIKEKILAGGELTSSEAYWLAEADSCPLDELLEASEEVTRHFGSRKFDSCSIINARSGRCPEDCKWCAQSAHYDTGAEVYPLVDRDPCIRLGRKNHDAGIGRYSLVTSGRAMSGKALDTACGYIRELHDDCGIGLCASMGLLDRKSLDKLREAGVTRYHCNLETAPSHFPTLCTTHSISDKIATIMSAREAGMEICSGGIIGMGESMMQRVEFALTLRDIKPVSIPINILQPIAGTPLRDMKPLTDDEILRTVAVFRLVHPRAVLRFAGGRARISPETTRRALKAGINGAIMGYMLTTMGEEIEKDKAMIKEAGYEF